MNDWILNFKRVEKPRIKIFCFSYAGGNSSTYVKWLHLLPDSVQLCPIQLPGRGKRFFEPAFTEPKLLMQQLTLHVEKEVNIPSIFFGHSLGSRLAWDLASRLFKKGNGHIKHLIASASRPPHYPYHDKEIFNQSKDNFKDTLRRLQGTPPEILNNNELFELVEPTLRADFEISHRHKVVPEQLPVPIHVLYGLQDSCVNDEQIDAWQDLTAHPIEKKAFDGNHFFLEDDYISVVEAVNDIFQNYL